MKVYSKFKKNCTAILLGEPDAKGVQAALITDPDLNDGVPFNGLTKPLEWSPTPLVPLPEGAPDEAFIMVYDDGAYELLYSLSDLKRSGDLLGFFKIVPPTQISSTEDLDI